jgi:hypothetical protein
VSGFIGSLKLAVTNVLNATPVALLAGTTVLTVGRIVSGAAAVVNDHTKFVAIGLPATSVTPVVMVAVQSVLGGRLVIGVNVAVLPLTA